MREKSKKTKERETLYNLVKDELSDNIDEEAFYGLLLILDITSKMSVEEQIKFIGVHLNRIGEYRARMLTEAWEELSGVVRSVPWYNDMHAGNGGIVSAGDDGFYMDFASWLTARGTQFLINYFTVGCPFVIKYIKDNNIPRDVYLYEGISYAFLDYAF